MTTFYSLWTVVLLVAFIAIVAWAYSRRRRDGFDRAARSVLQDETPPAQPGERKDG